MRADQWPEPIRELARCARTGLPVPFSSGTDGDGAGRFGINDPLATMMCAAGRLCGTCGRAITGEATFLIPDWPLDLGEGLAFADPPNHEACADDAMSLCPHIARAQAATRSDGTPKPDGWMLLTVGFYAGPPVRLRRLAYDAAGRLQEVARIGYDT